MSRFVLLEQCFNNSNKIVERYVYAINTPFKIGDMVKGDNFIGRITKEVEADPAINYKFITTCSKEEIKKLTNYSKNIVNYLCKKSAKVMNEKEILERAYNDGFFVWYEDSRKCYKEHAYARGDGILIVDGGGLGDWDYEGDTNDYYLINSYGDKWALTEEELIKNHSYITSDGRQLSEKQINVLCKNSSERWVENFVKSHTYKECSEKISKIFKQWEEENINRYDKEYIDFMEGWLQMEYCGGGH